MELKSEPEVKMVFERYPSIVRDKMYFLRSLVIETAEQTEDVTKLEECLKWGEPSYVTNIGSTLRIDWKPRAPKQYAMYFQCSSRLVETFKFVFGDSFQFERNRAIVFQIEQEIPITKLKACIRAALRYKKVKNLLTLGI